MHADVLIDSDLLNTEPIIVQCNKFMVFKVCALIKDIIFYQCDSKHRIKHNKQKKVESEKRLENKHENIVRMVVCATLIHYTFEL